MAGTGGTRCERCGCRVGETEIYCDPCDRKIGREIEKAERDAAKRK